MEGNRKLHRPAVSRDAKRYFRSLMTAVLTVTMVIGNMAASLSTAMAGQAIAKEEFRIHAEAIRAAAEKALKEGEPLTEPLAIGGKDKSLVKDYEKLLEANGTLYELDLFKDTETVKDVDGISLRVFMRLEEDDDPKSYALTGEEKLVFLYVNGSSETISARLNIDGYVSGFSTVRPYDAAFGNKEEEEVQSPAGTAGTEEETPGTGETQGTPGGSGGSGSGSGGSSGGGSGSAGGAGTEEAASDPDKADVTENADTTEGGTAGTEQTEGEREEETEETSPKETDQTPAEKEGEAETEEPEADESQPKKDDPTETREEAKNEENEGSGKTEAPSEDKKEDTGNQAAAGTENKDSGEKDNSGNDGSQDDKDQKADAADNAGNAGDSGQADTGHESSGKDSEDTAKDSAQDDGKDSGKDSSVKDDSSDSKDGGAEKADDSKDSSAKDTGDSKDSGAKDAGDSKDSSAKDDSSKDSGDSKDSGSKDTGSEAKDSSDSKDAGEGKEQAQAIGISLHEITRVAKGQASDSNADDENADSDYEEGGDPFDAEDAAKLAQEEQEKSFNRRGALSGKIYNLVSLEDSLTVRAFQTSLSKMGMDAGELAEGSHILTYNVNPVGSAVLVRTPELVRDEAEVTFGVIPQVGYHIKDVTVNGESLEETGAESMASSSDAVKKALASSSDAGKGNEEFLEEDARFYTIPSVLEDQEVEIWLAEETEEDSIKAGSLTAVADGYTVRVDFGIEAGIPEGAELEVTPVSDMALDYIRYELLNLEEPGAEDQEYALDIKIIADGQEIQPEAPVLVTIGLAGSEEVSDASVYHFPGTSAESIESAAREESAVSTFAMARIASVQTELPAGEELEATADEEGIRFYTEGFSVYLARAAAKPDGTTLADTDQDLNFIVVQKTFTGIKQDQIPSNFTIEVKSGSNTYALSSGSPDFTSKSNDDGSIVWRWKITGAEADTYTVSEKNQAVDGYDVKTDGEGDITVTAADMEIATVEHETKCSHTDWPVYNGTFFAASLTKNQGSAVITEHPLSASQRVTVSEAVVALGGPFKAPVHFYSIEEQMTSGQGFKLNDATITYDATEQKVYIGATSNWQHVATLSFDITEAQNPEIAITNTYTPLSTEFKLVKKVEGSSVPTGAAVSFKMYKYNGTGVPQENLEDTDGDGIPDGYSVYNPDNPVITTSNFSNAGTDGYSSSEPKVINGLGEGYYLLEEEATLAGYRKLEGYIRIRVSPGSDGLLSCSVLNNPSSESRPSWEWFSDPNDGENIGTLTVYNYTSPRLPDTGGPGVGLIKEFGWMLLILAMMMAGAEVRYYGDRRRKQKAEV